MDQALSTWKNRHEPDIVLASRAVRGVLDGMFRIVPEAATNRRRVTDSRQHVLGTQMHLVSVWNVDAAHGTCSDLKRDEVLLQARVEHAIVVDGHGQSTGRLTRMPVPNT